MNQINNHGSSLPHHRLLAYHKSLELLAAVRSAQMKVNSAALQLLQNLQQLPPSACGTNWVGTKPSKSEAVIAKNYLLPDELDALNRIVTAYLELAEMQAMNRRPMYMQDWIAKLDDSILSDGFLAEVRELPHKNGAAELLRKLLEDEIRAHTRTNVVKSRAFSEMLEESIKRYRNRAVTTLQVIDELIEIAKTVREDRERGTELGLTPAEVAFYDALAENQSAKELMGEPILMQMAQELARTIRANATIDWTIRESVRVKLRTLVKRLLKKYKYPPDAQEKATETVLKQAEQLAEEWAA